MLRELLWVACQKEVCPRGLREGSENYITPEDFRSVVRIRENEGASRRVTRRHIAQGPGLALTAAVELKGLKKGLAGTRLVTVEKREKTDTWEVERREEIVSRKRGEYKMINCLEIVLDTWSREVWRNERVKKGRNSHAKVENRYDPRRIKKGCLAKFQKSLHL